MARYAKDHKEETRKRMVEGAARAFKAGGLAEVSVPRLMAQVGLTHGGFYAHFESKDALIAEACRAGLLDTANRMDEEAFAAAPGGELAAIISLYLSTAHRDHPEEGCVIPALGGQIARQADEIREHFTDGFRELAQVIAGHMGENGAEPSDEALVLISGLAGAMLLSRAVSDAGLSQRILRAAGRFYAEEFAAPDAAQAGAAS